MCYQSDAVGEYQVSFINWLFREVTEGIVKNACDSLKLSNLIPVLLFQKS